MDILAHAADDRSWEEFEAPVWRVADRARTEKDEATIVKLEQAFKEAVSHKFAGTFYKNHLGVNLKDIFAKHALAVATTFRSATTCGMPYAPGAICEGSLPRELVMDVQESISEDVLGYEYSYLNALLKRDLNPAPMHDDDAIKMNQLAAAIAEILTIVVDSGQWSGEWHPAVVRTLKYHLHQLWTVALCCLRHGVPTLA